ncbi:hypothetical protein BJV82DRAFT_11260 [Fennellomyces sp. T-0311]|nr:hypothetical protein BJV82DRAFT_11260 [Fennellomyces sp. T-0311]
MLHQTEYVRCKEELKQRKDELQQLAQQLDEQKQAIERLTVECSVLREKSAVKDPMPQSSIKEEEKDELEDEDPSPKEQDDRPRDDTNTINVVHEKSDDPATTLEQLYCRYRTSTASYRAAKHEDELRRLRLELFAIGGQSRGLGQTIKASKGDASVDDDQKNVPISLEDYDTKPVQLSPEDTQSICNEMNRVLTSQIQNSERAQKEYHDNTKRLEVTMALSMEMCMQH